MATSWMLTYFGFGYAIAMSLFAPAVFSTILKDMTRRGRISTATSTALLFLQAMCSLVSIVVVIGLLFRIDKQQHLSEGYGWIAVATFVVGLGVVLASSAYLRRWLGLGPES